MSTWNFWRPGFSGLTALTAFLGMPLFVSTPSVHGLEVQIIADEHPTQATVITRTNNKGYNVIFWNFQLPGSFTGTGPSNTVTDLSFQFYQNTPQGGDGVIPQNIAIYNSFFDPGKYSTVQGSNLFKPIGNSYTTPASQTGVTPADGINTQQNPDLASNQLNMGTLTPGVNEPYGSHNFVLNNLQNPFNGTLGNASGQYSLVIWTESPQNYQWKGGGQLRMAIPGVTGIMTSVSPGYLDGTTGDPLAVTAAGSLAVAPVPEPSTIIMGVLATATMAAAAWHKRAKAARSAKTGLTA